MSTEVRVTEIAKECKHDFRPNFCVKCGLGNVSPSTALVSGELVSGLGLHTFIEIWYEVDRYSAHLIDESNEETLRSAGGDTPFAALAALALGESANA